MTFCRMLVISVFGLLVGCAINPTPSAYTVRDADEAMVLGCTFVGHFFGTSGWSGAANGVGQMNVQTEIREKAARAGATHVVWRNLHSGWGSEGSGDAYRCSPGEQ